MVKLQCSHCPFIASSLSINKDEACAEVVITFATHLKNHQQIQLQIIRDVQKTAATAATVIMIAKHSTLLNTFNPDDYIHQEFSKLVDVLQDCLGIEIFDNKPINQAGLDGPSDSLEVPPTSSLTGKESVVGSKGEVQNLGLTEHPSITEGNHPAD